MRSFHSGYCQSALIVCSIAAISVIAYLPAVNNFFISDDFTLLFFLNVLDQEPGYIFNWPSEFFRLISYVYFWLCFKAFGLNSEPYYWAGIALHAVASLLVYVLVKKLTKHSLAAWAAAVFFAAYERHHEAVMWISAANSTIVTLSCLVFLIMWERALARGTLARITIALALFAVALFSKESAAALAPVTMVGLVLRGYSARDVFRKSLPLMAMLSAFGLFWISQAGRNFFVYDGHYALSLHFFPVYARSLARLFSQTLPFLAALFVIRKRWPQASASEPPWNSFWIFFAALVAFAVVPPSFLTYLDHIPSRNTYFPAVGLAGLVGMLFATLYGHRPSARFRAGCMLFLFAIVTANISYIWLKKDPQFLERAAPTRQLIHILNDR